RVDDAPTLVTGADIELDATVEHVYDFEVAAPESRTEPEARAEPDTPVDPGPAVAEVVELLPAPAIEPVAEPAAPVTEPPAEAVAEARTAPYEPPASRFVAPMPEGAPRLHVAGDVASYLAVIRVVGVGGAGI